MFLSDDLVLDKNRRRTNHVGHHKRRLFPHIGIVFCAAANGYTDRIFVRTASRTSDTLNIIRTRRRSVAKQNFLQVADVDAHFKSGRAAQQIYSVGAKIIFDSFCDIFVDLRRMFFRF